MVRASSSSPAAIAKEARPAPSSLRTSTVRAWGKAARTASRTAAGSGATTEMVSVRRRGGAKRSKSASTADTKSVPTAAVPIRPRPQAMPTPIITKRMATSRGSLTPARKRMKVPRPTRPKARARLSPITTTSSAPATAMMDWVCAVSVCRRGARWPTRRRQGRWATKAPSAKAQESRTRMSAACAQVSVFSMVP